MKNRFANSTSSNQTETRLPTSRLLNRVAAKLGPTPMEKPSLKLSGYRIYDPERPRVCKTLMTDAQVLECRAAHEFQGVCAQALADRYGMEIVYMRKLLQYTVRSKLIPKRK